MKVLSYNKILRAIKKDKTVCSMQFIEGGSVINYTNGNTGMILDFICNAIAWVICESGMTVGDDGVDIKVVLRDIRKTILDMYNKHIEDYEVRDFD